MTSMLQFNGRTNRFKGVELQFYLVKSVQREYAPGHSYTVDEDIERVPCATCGKDHPQLYVAWRKPVGMWGCWVVFRYLGGEHVPDLSIPIAVLKVPKGARKLSLDDNSRIWHT